MSEAAAAVLESPTEVERGPLVNLSGEQRAEFRKTGELPKKEEAAALSETKEVKTGEPEAPKLQEKPKAEPKPKQTAVERIAELRATIAKIEKGAGIETKAEPSPAKPKVETQNATRPRPTVEDKTDDGKPKYATYEDFVEDLADWKSEQREIKTQRENWERAEAAKFKSRMDEARGRHGNFDEAISGFREAMGSISISGVVRDMLNDSDVFPDLVAVIGGSKEELAAFAKMAQDSPGKAIRYIALTESLIAEELSAKGKSVEEVPAKPKTNAPRPPSEAGGRSATPPDALTAAFTSGDFRSAKAEMNRRALAKLKG